jgi:hypothetical protein
MQELQIETEVQEIQLIEQIVQIPLFKYFPTTHVSQVVVRLEFEQVKQFAEV